MGNNMKPEKVADLKSKIRAIELGLENDILIKYPKGNWVNVLYTYKNSLKNLST